MKKLKVIGIKESFELAGAGVGMGILGESFGSEGLKQAGETATGFVKPMVNIGMGATTVNMLRNLNPKKKLNK